MSACSQCGTDPCSCNHSRRYTGPIIPAFSRGGSGFTIHGYDTLTYWALAALARLHDVRDDRDEVYRRLRMFYDSPPDTKQFAEVFEHIEKFEALHRPGRRKAVPQPTVETALSSGKVGTEEP